MEGHFYKRFFRPKEKCYSYIFSLYTNYLKKKYGKPTVVFDRYESGPNIKDVTHIRRKIRVSRSILFEPHMIFNGKKDEFLGNEINKQRFIKLLSEKLIDEGIDTLNAS